MKPSDKHYFKIEEYNSRFVDLLPHYNCSPEEKRKNNFNEGRLLNYWFPFTKDEIFLIQKSSIEGNSISEISEYFQRTERTIQKILNGEIRVNNWVLSVEMESTNSSEKIFHSINGNYGLINEEYLLYLRDKENFTNSLKKWTNEEDKQLEIMSENMKIDELCYHFKRLKGEIKNRLKNITNGTIEISNDNSDIEYELDEYFKIENENPKYLHLFTNLFGKPFDINKTRESNFKLGRLINYGFPIKDEEVEKIFKLAKSGYSLSQLENYFQRSRKTIKTIILGKNKNIDYQKLGLAEDLFSESDIESQKITTGIDGEQSQNINVIIDVSRLSERELIILKLRWGIGIRHSHSLEEVGNLLNISRDRVRQLEQGLFRKIIFKEKEL